MDFDWFYYISTVHLGMSEEEFLKSTPKKVGSLWKLHTKFNGWTSKEEEKQEERLCIDEIPFL